MKTEAHKKITEFSILQFLDSMDGPFRTMLRHEKNRIVAATEAEDVWYKNPDRPFHWHFFHPPGVDIPDHFHSILKFTLFSNKALAEQINRFRENLAELKTRPRTTETENEHFLDKHKDLSRAIGGILHHIQDMSTPSHVVPVFHGAPAPGGFEPVDDTFETFADQHIGDHLMDRDTWPQPFNEVEIINYPPAKSYETLYEDGALETLDFLKKTRVKETLDSTIFWKPYDFINDPQRGNETAGFGSYGPFEHCFTKDGGEAEINGTTVKITFNDFKHIYFHCLTEMIRNTYRCLKLFNDEYCKAMA